MASEIIFSTIDETYPVAGIDNDTQGFRDNFNIIKNALSQAATEVGNLQEKTAGLQVEATEDGGDFSGQEISNAVLRQNYHKVLDGGTSNSSTYEVNFGNGDHQILILDRDVQFSFNGIPNANSARLILEINAVGTTNRTATFFTDGVIPIKKSSNFPGTFTVIGGGVDALGDAKLIEIIVRSRTNGDKVLFLNYLGVFA